MGQTFHMNTLKGDRLRVISYIDPSINTITVSSINGSVNIGDKFTAFAVPPTEFTVTEINMLGGVGTISPAQLMAQWAPQP
jgi:hypothetical protein